MMKRQFHRMRQQLTYPGLIEQRIEPAKKAAHNVSKRLQACLQGQSGSEVDKRVKKLPLMALSITMAESFKELDTDSSMGKALEMSCFIQSNLAKVLAEFEIALEREVLQPLNKLSEEELPVILKRKKTLQKLISDWNSIKSRLNQAVKNSSNSAGVATGPGASSAAIKLENLREEEEEAKRRVEQCKDEYMADLYHFSTKEDNYANYFIKLLEIQAQYHQTSLASLDAALAELRETHGQIGKIPLNTPVSKYYGEPLEEHLRSLGREIALPIEACVMMLLASGMREEGLFRLAAGASMLRKLKCSLANGSSALEEFYSDPHAVAGALKSYLRELPQPLMTFDLYDNWLNVAFFKEPEERVQSLRDTCSRLPQDSYNNLRYLIKFLAKLAEHQEVNKMSPSNIAIVLGPNLLWSQQNTGDPLQLDLASVSSIQVVGVVEALIQNADSLFPGGKGWPICTAGHTPVSLGSRPVRSEAWPGVLTEQPADSDMMGKPRGQICCMGMGNKDGSRRSDFCLLVLCTGKRAAPTRPTGLPPQAQPRTSAPMPTNPPQGAENSSGPKAMPRRMASTPTRAPSMPPPLPPQPARRQSCNMQLSSKVPLDAKGEEACAAESPPSPRHNTEMAADCIPGEEEPSSLQGTCSPAVSPPAVQAPVND
uniref:SH3 domain binding protein 1 n=1 Tax=Crocodylus porosus TaxID=8502 RepID=A0A7M4G3M3_CROPO